MSSSLQSRLRGLVGASKKEKGSSSSKSKSSLSGGSSDPGALNSQSSHHQRSPSHSSLSATGTNTTASTPPSESHSSLADDAVADPTASSSSSPATAAAALPLTDSDAHHGSEDNAPGDDENPPAHLRAVSPSSGAAELDNGGSWTPPDATHGSAALLDTSTAPSADTAEPKGSKHSGSGGKGHAQGRVRFGGRPRLVSGGSTARSARSGDPVQAVHA
ncbi:hypothetical protein BC828DRAFT_188833 [Blastocladiella britannica]|nr:hypothetical protein BC828DRAFT_188833 [Blastocladiella britannica]